MNLGEIALIMGIPTTITGLLVWWFKRWFERREKARDEREKNIESLILLVLQNSRAANVLVEATARAVQRIPDAHCNGDMTKALDKARDIQRKEQEFLIDQGIKHIFED
jgi:hypothetical protein